MVNDVRFVGVLVADQWRSERSIVVIDDQVVVVDALVVPFVFMLLQTEAFLVVPLLHKQLLEVGNAIQLFAGYREVI